MTRDPRHSSGRTSDDAAVPPNVEQSPQAQVVDEDLPAVDQNPKHFVAAEPQVVSPEVDKAKAQQIRDATRRERGKDHIRPWLLICLGIAYLLLVVVGVWSAIADTSIFDNLLRLYAVIMPVLTAAIGAVAAYYFTAGSQGDPQ